MAERELLYLQSATEEAIRLHVAGWPTWPSDVPPHDPFLFRSAMVTLAQDVFEGDDLTLAPRGLVTE